MRNINYKIAIQYRYLLCRYLSEADTNPYCAGTGMDTDAVLSKLLGYNDTKIAQLHEHKIV